MTVFDDLAAEQERLAGILGGLDEAQWTSPSGADGWSVADVVLHLAQSEESVVIAVAGGDPRAGAGQAPAPCARSGPGWWAPDCPTIWWTIVTRFGSATR